MAAATTASRISVVTRNTRPLRRSRISRAATSPTSPSRGSSRNPAVARRIARRRGAAATIMVMTPSPPGTPRRADGARRRTRSPGRRPSPLGAPTGCRSVASSTSRTSPPSTSDTVTPGEPACPGAVAVPLHPDHQALRPAGGQVVDRPADHEPAVVDDGDRLAEVLHQVELVAGEQHAAPRPWPAPRARRRWRRCPPGRGRPAARRGRAARGRAPAPRRAGRAAGFRARAPRPCCVGPVGDAEPLEPRGRASRQRPRAHPVQPAEVLDLLADQHARVQAPLLRHVAEPAAVGLADRAPVPADRAGVELGQPEDRAHRGRLARAVRPEEAGHATRADRK